MLHHSDRSWHEQMLSTQAKPLTVIKPAPIRLYHREPSRWPRLLGVAMLCCVFIAWGF